MPTLLLLAYYFPPIGGAGAQRPLWLSRHLPAAGWRVVVLTAEHPDVGRSSWAPTDDTLIGDEHDIDVRRVSPSPGAPTKLVPPQRRTAARWVGPAGEAGQRIVREEAIDVVAATISPFELADVALGVGQTADLPVLLDLRDPWALDGWIEYRSRLDWAVEAWRMRRSLRRADAVVANTAEAARVLVARGGADSATTHHVPNGWSREDFDGGAHGATSSARDDPRLVLVHTGSFHTAALSAGGTRQRVRYRPEPIDATGRTPVPLVRALHRLVRRDSSFRDRIHVVHVGSADEATRAVLDDAPVDTTITGFVPHEESVAWLDRADVLFLPLHDLPNGQRSRIVPGKTYEYLGAGRPILAALPPGEARDLATTVPGSVAVGPVDDEAMADALAALVERHESADGLPHEPSPVAADYERATMARRFAAVLDGMLA